MLIAVTAILLAVTLIQNARAHPKPSGGWANKKAWQFQYQKWMAPNWRSIAQCETGTNFKHSNSSYVSAFGIQRGAFRGAYDSDARRVGMPPWSDVRTPTPWQQYKTALSHYAQFGDGWGCPGP